MGGCMNFQNVVNQKIKGLDNPTSQLLPIMSKTCCRRDGEGRKDKGGAGGCVCVCDTVVCARWCVTKKDGVCVCDKVACERWCVTKKDGVCACVCVCVTKLCVCVKDGVCVCESYVCVCVKESV